MAALRFLTQRVKSSNARNKQSFGNALCLQGGGPLQKEDIGFWSQPSSKYKESEHLLLYPNTHRLAQSHKRPQTGLNTGVTCCECDFNAKLLGEAVLQFLQRAL